MKPHLLKIPLQPEHSFNVRYDAVPHFYDKWHYHAEAELVYIIKGSGWQFIGDTMHHFKPGDLILLGANLPHLWRSDEQFLEKDSKLRVEAIVIHFLPDCFGETFFRLPENRDIHKLLTEAEKGVRVQPELRPAVAGMMKALLSADTTDRVLLLIKILQAIARSAPLTNICGNGLQFSYNPAETDRLNTIYQYIMDNFSRPITLEQMAQLAHLTPHAFCRYFKLRIKKTFSRFLLEVRIGHACKLLAETDKTVAAVCYECGFNNFSNFNRHFKTIRGVSPLAYRKHYQN